MKSIDRLIEEQVQTWAKRVQQAKISKKNNWIWPVITISREYGTPGRSLADELGHRTGFKVWDKGLLSAIAEEAGADEKFLSSLDEKRRSMINDVLVGSLMGSKHSNTHYFRSLLRVVHTVGEHGKSIIVGRGSNYIIKNEYTLRLRIVCPIKDRVAFVAEQKGMSRSQAENMIIKRDEERRDFIQHFFKKDVGAPDDYDLIINSGIYDVEQMSDLIMLAYKQKVGKALPVVV